MKRVTLGELLASLIEDISQAVQESDSPCIRYDRDCKSVINGIRDVDWPESIRDIVAGIGPNNIPDSIRNLHVCEIAVEIPLRWSICNKRSSAQDDHFSSVQKLMLSTLFDRFSIQNLKRRRFRLVIEVEQEFYLYK